MVLLSIQHYLLLLQQLNNVKSYKMENNKELKVIFAMFLFPVEKYVSLFGSLSLQSGLQQTAGGSQSNYKNCELKGN